MFTKSIGFYLLLSQDLIKNTATAHSDYDLLQKTLKLTQDFLENLENPSEKNGVSLSAVYKDNSLL